MSLRITEYKNDVKTTTDASIVNCTNASYTLPLNSAVVFRLRFVVRQSPDGYSGSGAADGYAVNDSGVITTTTSSADFPNFFSFAIDNGGSPGEGDISTVDFGMAISGTSIMPTITGIAATTLDWQIYMTYWAFA